MARDYIPNKILRDLKFFCCFTLFLTYRDVARMIKNNSLVAFRIILWSFRCQYLITFAFSCSLSSLSVVNKPPFPSLLYIVRVYICIYIFFFFFFKPFESKLQTQSFFAPKYLSVWSWWGKTFFHLKAEQISKFRK